MAYNGGLTSGTYTWDCAIILKNIALLSRKALKYIICSVGLLNLLMHNLSQGFLTGGIHGHRGPNDWGTELDL